MDQRLPVADEEVRVIEVPGQKAAGPLMVGVGTAGLAVTAKAVDVALQPLALVTVTLNEPAADTVIDGVVAPVDQTLPVAEDDVRVIVPPRSVMPAALFTRSELSVRPVLVSVRPA